MIMIYSLYAGEKLKQSFTSKPYAMGDSSQEVVVPQQESEIQSVKRSEMCIGLSNMMTLPNNIVITLPLNSMHALKRSQLVILKTPQGIAMYVYTCRLTTYIIYIAIYMHYSICISYYVRNMTTTTIIIIYIAVFL